MWGVLYVQIVFKLKDSLMIWELCFWKFDMESFVLLICKQKDSHSENKKKTISVTWTIKYSLDYTVMVSFFLLRYTLFYKNH